VRLRRETLLLPPLEGGRRARTKLKDCALLLLLPFFVLLFSFFLFSLCFLFD